MLMEELENCQPDDWTTHNKWFTQVDLLPSSMDYMVLKTAMLGNFATNIKRITRVENPYLYGSFLLKQAEYKSRGVPFQIKELYHDTAAHKIHSILDSNLDWRLVLRSKFGKGVSFSPSTSYANKYSSMDNGTDRVMIVTDVLVGLINHANNSTSLPPKPCDTSVGNRCQVYVKYYDDEFYPKYVIYYDSVQHVRRRHRWF